jgi:carbon monoxide dehydrogenase subunit G
MPSIDGTHRLQLPSAEAWRRLNDPETLARAIPGCGSLVADDDGAFTTSITIGIGAVKGRYDGTIRYSDVIAPHHCTIRVTGKGAAGSISGEGRLELRPAAADATEIVYHGVFDVRGRVAAAGARLLTGVGRKLITQTLENIERAATPAGDRPSVPSVSGTEPPRPVAGGTD